MCNRGREAYSHTIWRASLSAQATVVLRASKHGSLRPSASYCVLMKGNCCASANLAAKDHIPRAKKLKLKRIVKAWQGHEKKWKSPANKKKCSVKDRSNESNHSRSNRAHSASKLGLRAWRKYFHGPTSAIRLTMSPSQISSHLGKLSPKCYLIHDHAYFL